MLFTLEEIRETGRQHGYHGIIYYPPQIWGNDSIRWKYIDLNPIMELDRVYQDGYKAGYYERHAK